MLLLWIVLFFAPLFPQNGSPQLNLNWFGLDEFQIQTLPGSFFFTTFLENQAPDVTLLIEENNGFSLLDSPRVYFEGDSALHFNWFLDNFRNDSLLDDGGPALQLPFTALSGYSLQGEVPQQKDYGLGWFSPSQDQSYSKLMLSGYNGNLGGFTSMGKWFLNPHASERASQLRQERRKTLANYFIDYAYNKRFSDSSWMLALNHFNIQRQFNDFNTEAGTFAEWARQFLVFSKYKKYLDEGAVVLTAAYNHRFRGNLFSEFGRSSAETFEEAKDTWFAGLAFEKKDTNLHLSFQQEYQDLTPTTPNASKDLKDNDGEGMFPFSRWGSFTATRLSYDWNRIFEAKLLNLPIHGQLFSDGGFGFVRGQEQTSRYNALLFNRLPYQVIRWDQNPAEYRHNQVTIRSGGLLSWKLAQSISIHAKMLLVYQSLTFRDSPNNCHFLSPGYDLGILLFAGKSPQILFSYGRQPYELRPQVGFFLETAGASGGIYGWEDSNDNLLYESGEETDLFGLTGGLSHRIDPQLKLPTRTRLLLDMNLRLSSLFNLRIKGLYKKIKNNFWVYFDREYGHFENVNGKNLYFLDQAVRGYTLSNYRFDQEPFYAQFLLQLSGQKRDKWFVSFSFLAHIGMGYTAFGNGPTANDIGVISESQANPNSWSNGFGRLDGDRAFVAKLNAGWYLTPKLFLAASLKYRDGDPFAFINSTENHDQLILYYQTIRAEDQYGKKGGPREDFLADVNLQLTYYFTLFGKTSTLYLALFNLLDFGSELSENVFSGGDRLAAELQMPRSLRIGLSIHLM